MLTPIEKREYLPGDPRIKLDDGHIGQYLESELATRDLDRLAPHLWLVGKQDSSHISSLTHQLVRGRQIVITEKPELHLVWYYDRVFVKPLPKYLLSHAFWKYYLCSEDSPIDESLRRDLKGASLGFLRSYSRLVRHKSDFALAKHEDHCLLPKGVKYRSLMDLLERFDLIDDVDVSPRYHYGELRLSRLNFWSKILLFRFWYHKVDGQYGNYFARFYRPILFIFGVFSVPLSAMQVVLGIQALFEPGESWDVFARVSLGFSIFAVSCAAAIIMFLLLTFISLSSREIVFALRDLITRRCLAARRNRGQMPDDKR
ncbi:hypothetical protein GGS23DRAFT_616181 [Durotheca rogersii]|uniref:uncharacterized protein n=1 Tax=Durotheca rogersii TaxID=419775 RepID=UPI00222094BE|nr:uncharacterized protein GGS23DRAFT_616181 [Durotheca rogersii]KAI5859491.1 hypothetical protein GGS23DRAFT_616181 [Durotheca rogersii]